MRVIIPPLAGLLSCIGCINLTYRSLKLDPVVLNEFNDDDELGVETDNDPGIDGNDLDIDDNELGVETDNDPGIDGNELNELGNEPNDTCEFGVDPLDPG